MGKRTYVVLESREFLRAVEVLGSCAEDAWNRYVLEEEETEIGDGWFAGGYSRYIEVEANRETGEEEIEAVLGDCDLSFSEEEVKEAEERVRAFIKSKQEVA